MFTGIITDQGKVRAIEAAGGGSDARFVFATGYDTASIETGASIACSGACLTVVDKGAGWFAADVSGETLARTTLGSWKAGSPVNFERSLRIGDELGGHMVAGHVDGVARTASRAAEGGSVRFVFEPPADLLRFIAEKGSVALDGISLTVNEAEGTSFGVNIIAHTLAVTSFGALEAGDMVNLEVDLMARYAARLMAED